MPVRINRANTLACSSRPDIEYSHRFSTTRRVGPSPLDAARSHRLRVLVVEDNVDTADSLALLLKLHGDHVHVARSGPVALTAVGETVFDVILLDIGLPGLDGYSVARRIREMHLTKMPRLI